jgi:hypothetical protein
VRDESEELADAASRSSDTIFRALGNRHGFVQGEIASFKRFRARDEAARRRVPDRGQHRRWATAVSSSQHGTSPRGLG